MTERDRQLELANRIERELCNGFRHFTLGGAEMDWVIEALRRAYGEEPEPSEVTVRRMRDEWPDRQS